VLATNARNSSTSRMRDHVSSILSDHAEGYEGGVTDRLPPTCAVLAAAIAKSGQAEKETNCPTRNGGPVGSTHGLSSEGGGLNCIAILAGTAVLSDAGGSME